MGAAPGADSTTNAVASGFSAGNCGRVDWLSRSEQDRRQVIESIGVEQLGRRYASRLVTSLNEMYAAEDARMVDRRPDDDIDVDRVCFDGDKLTDEEFFRMILSALDAAHPHEGALWCIADGPMDHLVGRDRTFKARFHEERGRRASVQAAFDAMRDELKAMGYYDHSWWSDPSN